MKCKFCGAEPEENALTCPVCGEELIEDTAEETPVTAEEEIFEQETETTEETETAEENETTEEVAPETPAKPKVAIWKIVLAVFGCAVLLTALVVFILYGMGFRYVPPTNDIYAKDSYTIEDDKAEKKSDKVIATVGDMKLTNAELQVYYWNGAYNYANTYSAYLSYFGLDITAPLSQQAYYEDDSLTWQQYFLESAISNWKTYAQLCMMAKEEGFQVSEDIAAELDAAEQTLTDLATENGHDNVEQLLDEAMGVACNMEGYLSYISNCITGDAFYNQKAASFIPTNEEVDAYYTANEAALNQQNIVRDGSLLVDVRHILLTPEGELLDADGNVMKDEEGYTLYTDEAWAACQQDAEALLQDWLNNNPTEESFAELANTHSVDGGSNTNGGLYSQVTEGQMVPAFNDWIMDESRATGDYGLVKTPYGYHIMYFVSSQEKWFVETLSTIYNERLANMVSEMDEKWPLEVKYKNIVLSKDVLVESDEQ